MNKLFVLLVAVLLAQAAFAKRKGSSSSSDSSDSSSHHHKKNTKKVVTVARPCPACPPREVIVIREVTVCEMDLKKLNCPEGTGIKIHEAFYGRRNPMTCRYQSNGKDINSVCSAPNVLQAVRDRCTGRRECDLTSANSWFSDPCRGTYKYLEVSFSCPRI